MEILDCGGEVEHRILPLMLEETVGVETDVRVVDAQAAVEGIPPEIAVNRDVFVLITLVFQIRDARLDSSREVSALGTLGIDVDVQLPFSKRIALGEKVVEAEARRGDVPLQEGGDMLFLVFSED